MNARTDFPAEWTPLPGTPAPADQPPAPPAATAAAPDVLAAVLRLQATAMGQDDASHAAAAVATELATLLRCERVAVGWRTDGSIVVDAVSHAAEVADARAPVRALAAAMDEALDQAATLVHPLPPGSQPRIVRAHDELARAIGGAASVCTVPLVDGGRLVGALLFERSQHGFAADEIALAEHCASLLAPLLALKRQQRRSLLRHALDDVGRLRELLFGPGHPTAKLLLLSAVASAAMLGLCAVVPGGYRVSAGARIEGEVQRVLTAPVDGFVHQVHARPGDTVHKGQLLAELSRDELQLERRRWQSEAQQQEHAFGEALARHERTQMVIALSRAEEARAQLELTEQSLRRARLEAPFDGVVIQGDLSQSLGAPVKRGDVLLTIAQGEGYRVIVEVDERDIGDVQVGQAGAVTLAAAPARPLAIGVTRVTPVAAVVDGRNVFEVEAAVDTAGQTLRPGLRGAARIEAGERSLLWIATHRVVDWARLQLWWWLS